MTELMGPSGLDQRWTVSGAAAAVAWFGLLQISPESATGQWVSNVGLVLAAWTGAAGCLLRARRTPAERAAWLLLGSSAASWGCGQAIWTVYESGLGREVPFPSFADAGYLIAPLLLALGLLRLPSSPAGVSGRARLLLDGLVVGLSLVMLSWQVVLADTLAAGGDTWETTAISVAYPVADVVCVTIALVVLVRARHGGGVPVQALALLVLGSASAAVADSGFLFLTTRGAYSSGNPIDLGWFAGWLLLGLASRVRESTGASSSESRSAGTAGLLAPYIAVLLALSAIVVQQVRQGQVDAMLTWATVLLVLLLSVRQVVALRENAELTHTLEARVEERTRELAGREQWFHTLVQNLNDVVTVLDEDGVVTYQTDSALEHFGQQPQALVGAGLARWWIPADAVRLHHVVRELAEHPGSTRIFSGQVLRADGSEVPVEATVTAVSDRQARQAFVINSRDVTERRQFEHDLSHQAFHDALTGLANRALFRDRVEHALAARVRNALPLAVLFLDLDGFKAINDSLGHSVGDRLLEEVAAILLAVVRPGDTVARLGGDEFAILLADLESDDAAAEVAERIREALAPPLDAAGHAVRAQASCGIALYHGDEDTDVLLRNADLAMYRAKERGLGSFEVFEQDMHDDLVARLGLEAELRRALGNGELRLVYQPTISLTTGQWHSCEALLRWDHPGLGSVEPVVFIPLAEQTGLIVEVGSWALREACRQTAVWRREQPTARELGVAVNVSVKQLQAGGFLDVLDEALAASGLPAHALTIELTESVLIEHTNEVLQLLGAVKARGVLLAIDDFGTGYSSLSYLHRFPVDVLKVDRAFIVGMIGSSDKAELTRTIVQLGQSLGLTTVAEGIEEVSQLHALQTMRCDLGQGYLLSRPLRPAEIAELLLVPARPLPSVA